MTYKPIYKCRMCGETFSKGYSDKEKAASLINGKYAAVTYDGHRCADGSIGIADFQGFKAAEERRPRTIKATRLDEPNPAVYVMGE